jgi:uncharacterized repeat protein (TIGR01451 family)
LVAAAVPVVMVLIALLALSATLVQANPGFSITKSAPSEAIAGTEMFYYIGVQNDGITDTNAYVTDTLPSGVMYIADTGGCTEDAGALTCPLGDLEPGAYRDFQIKVYVPADAVAGQPDGTVVVENTAYVSSTEEYAATSAETFVEDEADLTVIKMSKPDFHVLAGQPFTYTIIVENLGPSFARGVALIDNIVSSGAFTMVGEPWMNRPGDCWSGLYPGYDGEVLFCGLGVEGPEPLEPKGYFYDDGLLGGGQWIIQLTVVASDTQDVNNVVNVFTADIPELGFIGTDDPNPLNNSAEDFIYVDDVADLSLSKDIACLGPFGCAAGGPAHFDLSVSNGGPSTAEGVVLEDYLPAGVTVDSYNVSGGGDCNTGTPGDPTDPLVCHLGDIAFGAAKQVQVFVHIDADYPIEYVPTQGWHGWLENDAWVYSSIFDPDNSDNLDSAIEELYTASNMFIQKACGPDGVVAGAQHEYIVLLRNDGPSTVRNFRFWDKLPADVTYLDFAIEGGDGECFYTENLPGVLGGGQGVHCWLGDMAPGTERAVHLTVRVNADTPPGFDLDNSVPDWDADSDIWYVTGDQDCSNEVIGEPNLYIEKTSDPDKVFPGDQITYDIVVTNDGPSAAASVLVTDTLPPEVSYEVDTDTCTYLPGDPNLLECDLGALPAGGSSSFQVYVRVDDLAPTGQITNTVTVNQVATDTVRTMIMNPNQADLGLAKTVSPGPYYAGGNVTFTLTVSNTGPLVAQNVVLEDPLPAGLTVVGVSASQGSCTTGTPGAVPLICNLGNLEVVQEVWVQVEAFIDPGYWGPMENDASVHSDVYDQDEGNNLAHVIVFIEAWSDLWLEKNGPTDVSTGQEIHYNIELTNYGPSTAHNVHVNDMLPDGVGLLGAEIIIGEGYCVEGTGLCSLGDVEPNEWHSIRVRGFVEPGLAEGTVLTNTAESWADSPFPGPLTSEVTTTVHSEADLSIVKTSDPYKVYAGEQKRYDIEVTNHGPGVAHNVVVTDTLPSGVEYEVATIGCDYTPPTMLLSANPGWGSGLFSVDLDTVAVTHLGDMQEPLGADIEFDALSGKLYASMGDRWSSSLPAPQLHTVDPETGASLGYVYLDEDCAVPALELVGSTLYATCHETHNGGDSHLVTLDPSSGHVTFAISDTGYTRIHGLAYDADAGVMYGVVNKDDQGDAEGDLVSINLATGQASYVCSTGWHNITGLDYGPDGVLYAATGTGEGGEGDLLTIDTDTCDVAVVGDLHMSAAGLTWWAEGSGPVCPLGDIPPGETRNFSIFVRVKPDTLGIINNQVDVSSDNDPNDGNDHWSEANLVLGKADLRVRKYGKPHGVVEAGEELIYTVIVDNLGPGFAHQVVLRDMLSSSSWAYDIYDVVSDRPADCSWQSWGYYGDEVRITCRLDDPLEVMSPSSSGRWVVKVYVDVYEEQSINNVADVVAADFDPDVSNNHAITEHEVEPVADLHLYKEAWGEIPDDCDQPPYPEEEDRVAAGAMLRYELEVCNDGPSTAENVVLEDWGISPLLDITNVWWDDQVSCLRGELGEQGDTDRRLTCYLGSLNPEDDDEDGYCKSVYIEGRLPSDVPEGTRLVNDAMVYGEVYDDENWNNYATNWTTVEAWADLEVVKTQEPEIALPTMDITYTITVTNLGPSDVQGVFISDTFPVQVLNPTWTCCASDGECDVPCEPPVCPPGECPWPDIGLFAQADIPADEYVIYTVEGVLDVWPCGVPFTNTVEILPPLSLVHPEVDIDPCDENNVDEVVNEVPFCNYDPLALKSYPGPDSPP